jgi:hypothetical protein
VLSKAFSQRGKKKSLGTPDLGLKKIFFKPINQGFPKFLAGGTFFHFEISVGPKISLFT